MTKKKRVIISLSNDIYQRLLDLQDSMFYAPVSLESVHVSKSDVISSLIFFSDDSKYLFNK